MYRVELIPKTSTLKDIIGPWVDSGRADNSSDGVLCSRMPSVPYQKVRFACLRTTACISITWLTSTG